MIKSVFKKAKKFYGSSPIHEQLLENDTHKAMLYVYHGPIMERKQESLDREGVGFTREKKENEVIQFIIFKKKSSSAGL